MKIDRLMGILTTVLQHGKVTAPYLAEKFEVSRRTISRDVEDLCRAGIPLVTEQGHGGGIAVAPGYRLDKTLLTREELQALLIGLRGLDSVMDAPHREALKEKLAIKGDSLFSEQEHILIDLASYYRDSLTEKIALLREAVTGRRRVSFRYYYGKGEETRKVEPALIVFQWSDWYLLGYCCARGEFRMFKLNRLWELSPLKETFEPREIPPEKLNFDHAWEDNYHLTALFDPAVKFRLIEAYGPDSFTEQEDGRLLFTRGFAYYDHLLEWVLGFGSRVTVLAPRQLRDDLRDEAARLLEQYGKPDRPSSGSI